MTISIAAERRVRAVLYCRAGLLPMRIEHVEVYLSVLHRVHCRMILMG